jgi:hypothetical protein
MRRALWTLCLAACATRTPPAPPTAPPPSLHPDLVCGPGTVPAGAAPPAGMEAWCSRQTASGEPERHGPSLRWHPNGQRAAFGSYEADQRHGRWETWHSDGTLAQRGSYQHGVEEGAWETWHPNGQLASAGSYSSGQPHGAWTYWTADGAVRTEGTYVLGAKDGDWMDLDPSGQPVRVKVWRGGRMVGQRELTP